VQTLITATQELHVSLELLAKFAGRTGLRILLVFKRAVRERKKGSN
jgi:hypothetical protein